MEGSVPRAVLAGLAVIFFGGGVFAYRTHTAQPLSAPAATVTAVFKAASEGDLDAFHKAADDQFYADFVGFFGDQKLAAVQRAYSRVYAAGYPRWAELRQRAAMGAYTSRQQLRAEVASLGRQAFAQLPVDRRLQIIEQHDNERFMFDEGINALSPEKRRLIGDVEAFRRGEDNAMEAGAAFASLSPEDQKVVGSPAALSSDDTAERTTCIDKLGLPLIGTNIRDEIGVITRTDLMDRATFRVKYGEPMAREYLARKLVPANVTIDHCGFVREDLRGGLLRGGESLCTASATVPGRDAPLPIALELRKTETRWRISQITPQIYEVWR